MTLNHYICGLVSHLEKSAENIQYTPTSVGPIYSTLYTLFASHSSVQDQTLHYVRTRSLPWIFSCPKNSGHDYTDIIRIVSRRSGRSTGPWEETTGYAAEGDLGMRGCGDGRCRLQGSRTNDNRRKQWLRPSVNVVLPQDFIYLVRTDTTKRLTNNTAFLLGESFNKIHFVQLFTSATCN